MSEMIERILGQIREQQYARERANAILSAYPQLNNKETSK